MTVWTHKAPMRHEVDVWVSRLMSDDGKRVLAYVEGHGEVWWARRPSGALLWRGSEAEARQAAMVAAEVE